MACGLEKYKVSIKNSETNMEKVQLKCLVLVGEFKKIKQECRILRVEKYLRHKATSKNISNAFAECQWAEICKRAILSVDTEVIGWQ